MKANLYTIGYEGKTMDEFIDILISNDVTMIIDVREMPLSRKKGFSKTPLKNSLEEHGISYSHMKKLGSPKELREKLKSDSNYDYFFNHFEKYIRKSLKNNCEELSSIPSNACLLCFEKDYEKCHRKIVAEYINELSGGVYRIIHK